MSKFILYFVWNYSDPIWCFIRYSRNLISERICNPEVATEFVTVRHLKVFCSCWINSEIYSYFILWNWHIYYQKNPNCDEYESGFHVSYFIKISFTIVHNHSPWICHWWSPVSLGYLCKCFSLSAWFSPIQRNEESWLITTRVRDQSGPDRLNFSQTHLPVGRKCNTKPDATGRTTGGAADQLGEQK